ncbi:DUF6585 family protein [Streptomyces sp. NPDC093085]|uniref:DUF6585 family protein n=1 Tax=Streptomyces sp. NPDC093085 TaxID=3155068 RepID=UPI0034448AE0
MSGGVHPWGRAEELLLARVSEAAGRARLGRRRATYRAPRTGPAWWSGGAPVRGAGARLDLYASGVTAAIGKRIQVIRYDTTVVRRRRVLSVRGSDRALLLVDIGGERAALRCGDFARPEEWGPEIRRSVTEAQVPRALAALGDGARLSFGPLWITGDGAGSRRSALPWAEIQRVEIVRGSVTVRAGGRRQVWATAASGIPNLCVFHALADQLAGGARDDG